MNNVQPFRLSGHSWALLLAVHLVAQLLAQLFRAPAPQAYGVVGATMVLWIFEVVPLWMSSLAAIVLVTVFEVLPREQLIAALTSQILLLLLGVSILVKAVQKCGLDTRCARIFLNRTAGSGSAEGAIAAYTITCWFTGMWISNTATCALFLPIALGIATSFCSESPAIRQNFLVRILLTTAFVPSIAGMSTPIGSLPNLIALDLFEKNGIYISFLGWMSVGVPVSLLLLIIAYAILRFRYPLQGTLMKCTPSAVASAELDLSVSRAGRWVVALGCILVALWLVPDILTALGAGSLPGVPFLRSRSPGVIALACTAPLLLVPAAGGRPLVSIPDLKTLPWESLLLFAAGLTIGQVLIDSGAAGQIAGLLRGLSADDLSLAAGVITGVAILLSEFCSNTAAAAVLVPIVTSTYSLQSGSLGTAVIFMTVFACGFGFALPISTPPNALVFGTKQLPLRDMVRSGIILDCIGLVVLPVLGVGLLPHILRG